MLDDSIIDIFGVVGADKRCIETSIVITVVLTTD